MKALSLKQPWAGLVVEKLKTIETRKWKTSYRGDIIICASPTVDKKVMDYMKKEFPDLLQISTLHERGKALGIVCLDDVVPMEEKHEPDALCGVYPGAYAWILSNIRKYRYFHHAKGQLSLFELDINDTDFNNQ